MAPQMTATFTKIRGAPAVYRWPGGLAATTLPWTRGLPHDLGHWLIEAQVDLPWGFWALAGRRAPFASFTLVAGRWPADRAAWLDRVRRRHGLAMLHAEAHDGRWLVEPGLDVRARWPEFEDTPLADLGPDGVERLLPLARRTAATWDALPEGGSVEVAWPGAEPPAVVPTETRGAPALPRPHGVAAVSHSGGDRVLDVGRRPNRRNVRRAVRSGRRSAPGPDARRR